MKIKLTEKEKKLLLEEIRWYFLNERDEDLGDLASILILDFITEKLGPVFYNKGINDASKYLQEKLEELYNLEI